VVGWALGLGGLDPLSLISIRLALRGKFAFFAFNEGTTVVSCTCPFGSIEMEKDTKTVDRVMGNGSADGEQVTSGFFHLISR